jgi:hypothetical protein
MLGELGLGEASAFAMVADEITDLLLKGRHCSTPTHSRCRTREHPKRDGGSLGTKIAFECKYGIVGAGNSEHLAMSDDEHVRIARTAGTAFAAQLRLKLLQHTVGGGLILVWLVGLAMCATSHGPPREVDQTSERDPDSAMFKSRYLALEKLKYDLRDPASASFRNVAAYRYDDGFVFCGELNANNGFGGKSGFVPFFASFTDAYIADDGASLAGYQRLSTAFCSPTNFVKYLDFSGW